MSLAKKSTLKSNLRIKVNKEEDDMSDDEYDEESSGYDGGDFSQITMNNFLKDNQEFHSVNIMI